ncbi:hypothetical protein PHMEG_0001567 [Phytophthora megakarya]|uniref:Uncharacterized protein n=1 Tax=Phytophthora megakarya TaxID=4795 RepID=A0A225X0X8_9STRA|nr:hypothetical protein PHMEG_0001567 [Phytophthora megakarya]
MVAVLLSQRILVLLGLDKSSTTDELRIMIGSRFRQPQQVQLIDILNAQSSSALSNVISWFSHQFDPADDVEHYLQDLIRMHNYVSSHDRQRPLRSSHLSSLESHERNSSSGTTVTRQLMHFYASFADSRDRHLITQIYQTLSLSRAITYCVVANTMSFKFQKEFLDVFAGDLPQLREWINWLDDLDHVTTATSQGVDEIDRMIYGTTYESAVNFVSRAIREHCMITWFELLRPLDTSQRLALIDAVHKALAASYTSGVLPSTTSTLKKLGRFYETTGICAAKLLDLDVAVRRELSLLLEEFPTIILITLFAKFNNEKMIQLIVKRGLPLFPKNDLLKVLDALAPAETNAIEVFVTILFIFREKVDFLLLFLTFTAHNQLRFLDIMVTTSNSPSNADVAYREEDEDPEDAFACHSHIRGNYFLLKFFLYARLSSPDLVIQKLSILPSEMIHQLMYDVVVHSAEDMVVLGRGLEIVELPCLQTFLRIFLAIQPDWREPFVKLVEDMPGEETLPLYDTLLSLHATTNATSVEDKISIVLQMLSNLDKKNKELLCRNILVPRPEAHIEGDVASPSFTDIYANVLLYLCECELARHKVLRLLRAIPYMEYDRLLFFLRTQKMPEQVALTRLMLSMPSEANCRLLSKMSTWTIEALDSFFQVLLMLAKVEYKMFAKMMGSQYISAEQLEVFIIVAANMMNQASSRELVIFAAELPIHIRNLLFEMLADRPEKGVLLRIINYSTRVPPELMHELVALFHRMSWDIRSTFVEQLRALEGANDVQSLADVTSNLQDNESLRQLILLLNPLQIQTRVSLVDLFLKLSVHERALLLSRLVKMPKNSVKDFCVGMCSPSCEPATPSFCRVIGLVDPKYHDSLLRLLKSEPLWFFLRLMAEYSEVADQSLEDATQLLNRVAKLVCMFTVCEHFLVLKSVIRDALGDTLPLKDIVDVLALFSDVPKVLDFLRYANGFAKYARTSLIFRVFSKYQQPTFIFEMCRILDLDDAVFALKRLERMWQRRHDELDKAMAPLARLFAGGSTQVKDDFCDLIVGFRGLSAAIDDDYANGDVDVDNPEGIPRLPSTTPPSHQPVPLNRHLQRTRPGQAFPRKRTDRKSWWQDLDDTSFLLPSSDRDATSREQLRSTEQQQQDSPAISPKTLPSVFVLTEHSHIVLTISRSESAPATLTFEGDTAWSKRKRLRGVAAALDNPLEFHVGRDKGADFLQKQRQRVYQEKGASHIRYARTPAAQAHVMEARVYRALGKRQVTSQPTLSPLTRPDSHTVENAVAMLAKAAQFRELTPQGFITEATVHEQTPANHSIRMLPTPAPSKSNMKPEVELSCEPLAPW